jgi:hypothetical protein
MTTPLDNPPEPLPLNHKAWMALYVYFIAACDQQPPTARDHLFEVFDSLDYFQRAVAKRQVIISPLMKVDGLYYRVSVVTDTGSAVDVTDVHSANLGMTAELLEADVWLANANALAKGAPDTPEGIDGA